MCVHWNCTEGGLGDSFR